MIRSLSRAPIKKDVLQQCGDCGLNFEGLDELRDHLKVVFSQILISLVDDISVTTS